MLLSFLALALVDSINPSAIVVTLYLLGRQWVPARVVVYVAAIFVTYLTLGAMMMSGIDALLPSVRTLANSRFGFIVQSLIGIAMLVYAIRAPATARSAPRVEPRAATYAALALLGVTVTAMELPTAVPYFGAIALLTAADLPTAQWLPLLAVYNPSSCCRPYYSSWAISPVGDGWKRGTPTSESDCKRVLTRRCCGSVVSSAAACSSRASWRTSPGS